MPASLRTGKSQSVAAQDAFVRVRVQERLQALFAGPPEHGAGGSAEQGVEEWPVVVEEGPQQVGHREGDVLPVAVGKDMTLLRHPLLRSFEAVGAAGF